MNPLNDQDAENEFDRMLAEVDAAGYTWDGGLVRTPTGRPMHGLSHLSFYLQVYKVYDHMQWVKRTGNQNL